MRYEIKHGATIETATPQEVADAVAKALDDRAVHDYKRLKGVVQLNGAGTGSVREKVSSQYDWRIERVSIGGAGAVNALVGFYENATANPGDVQSGMDLLEIVQLGAAGLYTDSFSNDLWLPANTKLLIYVQNGVANGQVTWNLQIRETARGIVG